MRRQVIAALISLALWALGGGLVIAGVALWSRPAALIAGGLAVMVFAWAFLEASK